MTDDEYNPSALLGLRGTAEPNPGHTYTEDLPDAFFLGLVRVCDEVRCQPSDLLAVMMNESGIRASAHNPNGNASGLIQFMPFILPGLGFTKGSPAFRQLTAVEQLPYVARYLRPHTGRLVNATALYLAVFLPALIDHATDPNYALSVRGGRLGWAYAPNVGFDQDHDGSIRVAELTQTLARVMRHPRYVEACARVIRLTTPGEPTEPAPPDVA